ncbi:universal stress protein [Arthrobacter sp. B3I4]|uniref:universal stress protein n=1 Tax=Arthrobacter sp. B3I4 TaxID=3042267 RepID=UPI0027823FF0|nr:universal stress protein [Arthrobacter sp. B3I4]MDQ0754699.1 nucleotide-binding universal stress UspA family protein [Arthrobacter sp. B3I4]
MRYVVGYSANARGRDAVNLAVSLARGRGAALDLVMAIPEAGPFNAAHAPAAGYDSYLHQQAEQWLDEALALIPKDVPAQAHIRSGESDAQTLIGACEEFQADMLIIGATSNGLFKRFTVGSVASALLHAATVPVALAPHGYHRRDALTRVSCGLGDRPGAEELLDFAVSMAVNRAVPLRVVSLLTLDEGDSAEAAETARSYANKHLDAALPAAASGTAPAGQADVVVAQGRSVEEAVDRLDWEDGEVLLIGSSRLARNRSIFLGSTANRILRALPVPMIVVPSDYELKHLIHSTSNDTSREATA